MINERDVDQLGMEVALLIAAARSKGIDPAIWLHIEENEGMLARSEFNDKMVSLAAAVGIQENAETKRELQFATSVVSLNTIAELCGDIYEDEESINCVLFLRLCEEKIRLYLEATNPPTSGAGELEVINQISSDRQQQQQFRFSSPPKAVGPEDEEDSGVDNGFNFSNPYDQRQQPYGSPSKSSSGGAGGSSGTPVGSVTKSSLSSHSSHNTHGKSIMHMHRLSQSPYDLELSRHHGVDEDEGDVNFYVDEEDQEQVQNRLQQQQEEGGSGAGGGGDSEASVASGDSDGSSNGESDDGSEYCDDECEMNTVDYEEMHGKFPGHTDAHADALGGNSNTAIGFSGQARVGGVTDSPTLSLASEPDAEATDVAYDEEQNTSFPKPSQMDPMTASVTTRLAARTRGESGVTASVPSQRPQSAGAATGKPSMMLSGRASLAMGDGVAVTSTGIAAATPLTKQQQPSSDALLKQLQGVISDLVHKPEVFHIIRVKLGLFNNNKPYTITPARGPIIFSPAVTHHYKKGAAVTSCTEWISLKDIQRVFGDCGLRLSELHLILLLKLIVVFATQCQQGQLSVSSSVMGELIANANNINNSSSSAKENCHSNNHGMSNSNVRKTANSMVAKIPKVILNREGVQMVNTFWLSKYLTYSRITKSSGSSSSTSNSISARSRITGLSAQSQDDGCIGTGISTTSLRHSGSQNQNTRRYSMASVASSTAQALRIAIAESNEDPPALIPHDQWLLQKAAQQKAIKEEKIEQFKKALSGVLIIPCTQPQGSSALSQKILAHAQYISSNLAYTQGFQSGKGSLISAADMDSLMLKYEVIPKNLLDAEIALRKDFWLYDCDGRKDFLHHMNVALHKVQHQQPTHVTNSKIPVNLNWKKLSSEEKSSILQQLTEELCEEKVNELYHLEHVEAMITKSLYWKYLHYVINNYNVSSPSEAHPAMPWGKWLEQVHLSEFEKAITASQTNMQERQRIDRILRERKSQIAPFNIVEAKLMKVSVGLSSFHQLELQKKLIDLRKNATFNSPLLTPLPTFKPNTDHRPKKATRAPAGNVKPVVPWIKCRDTGIATHGLIISKNEYETMLRDVLAPCTADLIANKLDEELVSSGIGYWEVKKQLEGKYECKRMSVCLYICLWNKMASMINNFCLTFTTHSYSMFYSLPICTMFFLKLLLLLCRWNY